MDSSIAVASVFTDGRFSTPMNYSYFQSVTCSSGTEFQLKDCDLDDSCSTSCSSTIGIRCYGMLIYHWLLQLGHIHYYCYLCHRFNNFLYSRLPAIGRRSSWNHDWQSWSVSQWSVGHYLCRWMGHFWCLCNLQTARSGWRKWVRLNTIAEGIYECCFVVLRIGPTAITNSSMFGEGTGPVVYSNVLCDGWESNVLECPRSLYGTFQCLNRNAAGVTCRDGGWQLNSELVYNYYVVHNIVLCPTACADGEVRLSNGTVATEGTVEICYDSLWRLVAATNWVDRNAAVVCRQLGIRDGSGKLTKATLCRSIIQCISLSLSR